jgi:NitT/TauT family transport system substrate-binding protein
MRRWIGLGVLATLVLATPICEAQTVLRVGWCAKTVTSAAAPFAIADKLGWFGSFKVELVPLAGSADCVKYVGTKEVAYSLPSIEPLGNLRPEGLTAKVFYTAYQGNIYGLAVPEGSPITTLHDIKQGHKIGVASLASGGAIVARAVLADLHLSESDVPIIVIGEGGQAAALTRSKQVDILSLYDTQYALIDNAGVPVRPLANPEFDRFPGNGFIALDDTLTGKRAEAVALARGYAMGTVFAIANPEAAVRIIWEQFPQTKATGKDEATALKEDVKTLEARIANWRLDKGGVQRWGESSMVNYQAYLDFLVKWGVVKRAIKAEEVVTNDLVGDIDNFDAAKIASEAKTYKP